MDILIILILTSLGVAAGFLGGFFWAVKSGQYEDTRTPALRVLFDETESAPAPGTANRTCLDTTTNIRGSAKRNAAFAPQQGAMPTPRPEGCVPVIVTRCDPATLAHAVGGEAQASPADRDLLAGATVFREGAKHNTRGGCAPQVESTKGAAAGNPPSELFDSSKSNHS